MNNYLAAQATLNLIVLLIATFPFLAGTAKLSHVGADITFNAVFGWILINVCIGGVGYIVNRKN